MLPKKNRLNRTDFILTKKTGRSVNGRIFSFVVAEHSVKQVREPKIAVVVSTKVSKSAVVRNRLRRQVYKSLSDFTQPVSLIFYLHPEVINLTDEKISSELHSRLSKINLF